LSVSMIASVEASSSETQMRRRASSMAKVPGSIRSRACPRPFLRRHRARRSHRCRRRLRRTWCDRH
jgi:hypothetical protein